MGCTIGKNDRRAHKILDQITFTVVNSTGRDDVQLEIAILAQLQNLREYANAQSNIHPIVVHEFNHAMTMLHQRRPVSLHHIRSDITKTLLAISAKTPTPSADVVLDNVAYLADPNDSNHQPRSFNSGNTPFAGGGKYTNAVAKFMRDTPCSTPERTTRKSVSTTTSARTSVPCCFPETKSVDAASSTPALCHTKPVFVYDNPCVDESYRDTREVREFSRSTDSYSSFLGKFRSFYASSDDESQETLSDFGFFDHEEC